MLGKVLADPIPSATQVAPDLPAAVDRFFSRVLVRDRDQRFSSVREMADELAAISGAPRAPAPSLAGSGSFAVVPAVTVAAPEDDETRTLLLAPPARAPVPRAPAPPVEPLAQSAPLPSTQPIDASPAFLGAVGDARTHADHEISSVISPAALTGDSGASRTVHTSARAPLAWIAFGASLLMLAGSVAFFVVRGRAHETGSIALPASATTEPERSIAKEPEPAASAVEPVVTVERPAASPSSSPSSSAPAVVPAPAVPSVVAGGPAASASPTAPKPSIAPKPTANPVVAPKPTSPKPKGSPKGLVDTGL